MSPEIFNMGKSNTLFLSKIDREDYRDTNAFYQQCLNDLKPVRESVRRGMYDKAVEDLMVIMSREYSQQVVSAIKNEEKVSIIIESHDGQPVVKSININKKND